jgi:CRP/FNR family cyclic AMP-dependent transcriptional regulator
VILRTDTTPPGVFCVKEGYVKVYSVTDVGEENLHIIYGPDTIFPIIWAITGRLRQVFYESMDNVLAYRISREDFLTFTNTDPADTKEVLAHAIDMANANADRIDGLEYTHGYSRIVYQLIALTERHGKPHGSGVIIMAPVKHHDIASSTNCSRETVSREIGKLEKMGLIEYEGHLIVVTNIQMLQRELLRV